MNAWSRSRVIAHESHATKRWAIEKRGGPLIFETPEPKKCPRSVQAQFLTNRLRFVLFGATLFVTSQIVADKGDITATNSEKWRAWRDSNPQPSDPKFCCCLIPFGFVSAAEVERSMSVVVAANQSRQVSKREVVRSGKLKRRICARTLLVFIHVAERTIHSDLPFFEPARLRVRLNHVASFIVNANDGIM